MTRTFVSLSFGALVVATLSVPGAAQAPPPREDFRHATTLSARAGIAADGTATGAALGASIGWQLTPAIGLEGSGSWLDRGDGTDGFAAAFTMQGNLMPKRRAGPFVEAGAGMYIASFEASASPVPAFYQERMKIAAPNPGSASTFTDPALVFGGGLNVQVTRHVFMRPAVEATLVWRDGRSYVVTTVAVSMSYRFEHHPVTASRRSK